MIRKRLNNLTFRTHMMISIGTVVLLAFSLTIAVVSIKTNHMAKEIAMDKAMETAHRYGNRVEAELQVSMDTIRSFSSTMEGIVKHRDTINRTVVSDMLRQILQSNEMFKGIFCVFEPNMLDGRDAEFANRKWHDQSGMFYPYFYKKNGAILFDACNQYKEDDYYQVSKKTGKESIIDPYIDADSGNVLTATVAVPIMENNRVIGVAGIDIELRVLQALISTVKIYETGYLSIISNKSLYVSHPDTNRLGAPIFKTDPWAYQYKDAIRTGQGFQTNTISETAGEPVERICVPIQIGQTQTPWAVLINVPEKSMTATAREITWLTITVGSVSLLVLMSVIFLMTHSMTAPLKKSVNFALLMADGDFTKQLAVNQKDEVGILAGSLNNMASNLGNILRDVQNGIGELTAASHELSEISSHMEDNSQNTSLKSHSVNADAQEMNKTMNVVAAASEKALDNLNLIAVATEEMTATITEIAQNTETASEATGDAVNQAQNASKRVTELGEAALEIGKVTDVITEISEQTNLLALNATIEAARAGEAGKGFAVVADEIKALAKQTTGATDEIKAKINTIQRSITATVDEIKHISDVNNAVNDIVSTIATAVEEQSVTTKEVAESIAQASMGFSHVNGSVSQSAVVSQEISKNISEIDQAADSMSSGSSQVKHRADRLQDLSEQLSENIKVFKV